MLAELVCAFSALYMTGVIWFVQIVHYPLRITGLTLAAATWLFTFGLAVPDHGRLEHGFDARVARRLVTAGWLRCAAWTAHGVVALALLRGH